MLVILELRDVSLRREQAYILNNISWRIDNGQHWAILGLNGSGKTTLLNIINGYLWPSQGQVEVLGKKFGSFDLRELRKSIGWVSSSLQEKLYVSEQAIDIVISGKYATIGLYTIPVEEDYDIASDYLKKLGCAQLANRIYSTLSQGEKQKILIARALMSKPQLLILDEPCSGLDIFAREHLLLTIEQLAEDTSAPTLIYVTHHIEEIMPVFNQTLLIRKGNIHSQGQTKALLTSENLSDFFQREVEIERRNNRAWLTIK
jgi:iron complex transport system ATP-binding protein